MNITDIRPCDCCGGKIAPAFYRASIEHMLINFNVIQQHAGLAAMLGSPGLATVMGDGSDAAQAVSSEKDIIVCQLCALEKPLARVLEIVLNNASKKDL